MKEEIRKILNVPKEQRIAQYIYNCFRDREQHLEVIIHQPKRKDNEKEYSALGIDIFDVSDAEFIERIVKGL